MAKFPTVAAALKPLLDANNGLAAANTVFILSPPAGRAASKRPAREGKVSEHGRTDYVAQAGRGNRDGLRAGPG
mgnify:CR=1 FL=1